MTSKKEKVLPEGWRPLAPSVPNEPIVSRGTVQYSERRGGRTVINIKKDIQREFQDLVDRTAKIHYEIELHRTNPQFKARVDELIRERKIPPFLLTLFKGNASKGEGT